MVKVAVLGANVHSPRSFDMEKTVSEVLDELVTDRIARASSLICFMGKVLSEETKLCDVPKMKNSYTLHVMRKKHSEATPVVFDEAKFRECRKMFKKINTARRLFEVLSANLNDEAFCTSLCEKFPALKEDQTAYKIFTDIAVGNVFLRSSSDAKLFLEDHPILVEVFHHVINDILKRPSVSAFLAGPPGGSFPGSLYGADGLQASSSANPRHVITSDMLRQAMADALAGANNPVAASAAETVRRPHLTQYAAQMAQLVSLGFSDIEQNTTALEATNGDVDQALELLFVMRDSMQH